MPFPSALKNFLSALKNFLSALKNHQSALKNRPSALKNFPSALKNRPSALKNHPSALGNRPNEPDGGTLTVMLDEVAAYTINPVYIYQLNIRIIVDFSWKKPTHHKIN